MNALLSGVALATALYNEVWDGVQVAELQLAAARRATKAAVKARRKAGGPQAAVDAAVAVERAAGVVAFDARVTKLAARTSLRAALAADLSGGAASQPDSPVHEPLPKEHHTHD